MSDRLGSARSAQCGVDAEDMFQSLIEALLPTDCPASDRAAVAGSADRLLNGRVAALAVPMRVGILGVAALFHALAFCILGRSFGATSLERRRRFIGGAERAPLVPFRALIRLARSFTLIAFYDHPLTRRRIGFQPGGDRSAP